MIKKKEGKIKHNKIEATLSNKQNIHTKSLEQPKTNISNFKNDENLSIQNSNAFNGVSNDHILRKSYTENASKKLRSNLNRNQLKLKKKMTNPN